LGSYVFEKALFIEWFRSIYVVPIKNIKPVDLFKHQKLSKLSGANHAA
jgi:hypothetical protein